MPAIANKKRSVAVIALKPIYVDGVYQNPGDHFNCSEHDFYLRSPLGQVELDKNAFDPDDWRIDEPEDEDPVEAIAAVAAPPEPGPMVRMRCVGGFNKSFGHEPSEPTANVGGRLMIYGQDDDFPEWEAIGHLMAGKLELAPGAKFSERGQRALAAGGRSY